MKLTPDLIVFCVGLVAFTLGLAWIYPPASLIGFGIVVMASVFWDNGK